MIFIFLTSFIQCDHLSPSMLLQITSLHSFLWPSCIRLRICTTSCPSVCRWTFRLFPCLDCCEQCCCERGGACIFLNQSFVQIYAQELDCWIIQQLYFSLFEEPAYCSVVAAPIYIPTSSVGGFPFLHILCSICYLQTS